jgi:hypothetical protein
LGVGRGVENPSLKKNIVRKSEMTQASNGMGIQHQLPGMIKELWIRWKKVFDRNIWGRIIKEAKVHKGL